MLDPTSKPAVLPAVLVGLMITGVPVADVERIPSAAAALTRTEVRLAAEDITIDFVRHGQSAAHGTGLSTVAPGAGLSELGQQQADAVAPQIDHEFDSDVAGIYASGLIRAQETAAPLAALLDQSVTDLSGLNAVNGGIFEGMPKGPVEAVLNGLAPLSWILGQYWVPAPGSSDYNGMAFEHRFSEAVQTMYDDTVAGSDDKATAVAFSHEGAISVWTLMNVKNPDFDLILNEELLGNGGLLSHTGQVVIEGNPTDGWTLLSWDGHEVPADPGLLVNLFVDLRDLIVAPQMALFEIQQGLLDALGSGNATSLTDAIGTGVSSVGQAVLEFPQAVIDDLIDALNPGGSVA